MTTDNPSTSAPAVRWGLVGTHGWADHTFAPAVRAAGARLVGAAGSYPEGSKDFAARHEADKAYPNITALVEDDDIDVIWVASPTDQHAAHALLALRAGKHVLVEKPLCADLSDGQKMVDEVATRPSQITAVGFQHRFNPAHARLAHLCREGAFGDLGLVRLHFFAGGDDLPTPWRRDPDRSGGWAVNDLGTHLLDLCLYILGDATVAGAATVGGAVYSAPRFGQEVDDLAVLLIQCRDAAGLVEVSTGVPGGPSAISVHGTKGHAHLENSWPGGGRLRHEGESETFEPVNTYACQVSAINAAVRGESPWSGATWVDGLRVSELIVRGAELSAHAGR